MSAPLPKAAFQDGAVVRAEVKRRRFTREENNLIATLYEQGVGPSQIAARIGTTKSTIETKLRAWGVERVQRPLAAIALRKIDRNMPREDQFAELLSQGFSIKEIGQAMGYKDRRSANATFQRIRRHMGPQAA